MERISESYELSTGKLIHPNRGIIGLTEYGGFKIYEGYDGTWTTEEEAFDEEYIELTNAELTNAEQKEIALYMSDLWRAMANSL